MNWPESYFAEQLCNHILNKIVMCPMMLLMINHVLQSPAPLMHQKQKEAKRY
jgi:hypothetical protein